MSIRNDSVRRGRLYVRTPHGGVDSFCEPEPEHVRRPTDALLQDLALGLRQRLENVVGEVALARVSLAPDSDAQARKLGGPEMVDDRSQPLLPSGRPARLQ